MSKERKMQFITKVLLVIFLIFFLNSGLNAAELPKSLSIGTHPKGSSFNAIGSGMAKVISLHTEMMALDRPFSGYSAWVPMLSDGKLDLGIVGNVDSYHAYHGLPPFKEKNRNLRMISSGNNVVLGYFVKKGTGLKTMADLKGKRVVIDPTAAGTGGIQRVLIKAAKLDINKDITQIPVAGVTAAVDALINGRADAAWASVGMGKVKEAILKVGDIQWLSVCSSNDDDAAKTIMGELNAVGIKYAESGSLPTLKNSAWLIAYPVNLLTHKNLDEEAAYLIAKVLWENQKELSPIHPMLVGWTKKMISTNVVFPYHPGAVRFYKEAKLWSDSMQQLQDKLSAE